MTDVAILLLLYVFALLLLSYPVNLFLRLGVGIYYVFTLYSFSQDYLALSEERDAYVQKHRYNHDHDNKEDTLALERHWDEQSNLVGMYEAQVNVPIFLFIVYAYYRWFSFVEERRHKIWIAVSILPVLLTYTIAVIFFGMQGYQP
ncbi:hypothetical protein N781_09550 [Pontibacillus halophilus JSM 076056 = DSM 19796]|uniref:Uncharacterized protein n=1 Tax=Pontibacillus halophilus JSM 076056 = DSM 19796 TaxID=1385510 RepID=A0A0A5GC23_9BACI|nr:hypothetical protein [Pontibacillus halophilus]KGX88753.1 hypothetical protein N781_09550 [Pontibacillus halophilus JSM 076056 = DSM 19796]